MGDAGQHKEHQEGVSVSVLKDGDTVSTGVSRGQAVLARTHGDFDFQINMEGLGECGR